MDHGDIAEAAAEAGKHLLVEKPFCFDPAEGRRVLSAVERNGVKLMVGYMKRYDPGYIYGMERMRAMEDVRLIRVPRFRRRIHRARAALYLGQPATTSPQET